MHLKCRLERNPPYQGEHANCQYYLIEKNKLVTYIVKALMTVCSVIILGSKYLKSSEQLTLHDYIYQAHKNDIIRDTFTSGLC